MSDSSQYRIVRPVRQTAHYVQYEVERLDRFGKIEAQLSLQLLEPWADAAVERLRSLGGHLRGAAISGIVRFDYLLQVDGRWAVLHDQHRGVDVEEVRRHRGLGLGGVATLLARTARILHKAYGLPGADGRPLGLLHGSLTARSLVLTDGGQVWIRDFGLIGAEPTDRRGRSTGRWDHVPPERWRGYHTRAGEVYSLGTVAYELLTGELFGHAANTEEEHARRVERSLARVPEDCRELLSDMLAWSPASRPSWLDVSTRLDQIARGAESTLRRYAEDHVAQLRRGQERLPADGLSNRLFEASLPDITADDEPMPLAWDDVTASYPRGALRRLDEDTTDEEAPPTQPSGRARDRQFSQLVVVGAVVGLAGALMLVVVAMLLLVVVAI